jgi:multidrug efflux pump subunit AcrA (membrane-fusion protein)
MWVVRLALRRPYTVIVMAMSILLLGVRAIATMTKVRIPNQHGALLAGMYAQVRFRTPVADPPLALPATALIVRAKGPQVATVGDDQTVRFKAVGVGRDLGTTVEIVSGLTGSELVITNPADNLREGMRIQPQGA